MRQILRKDLIREIKKSFARFISIAILIGMGTTFFVGLNSAAPNMLQTADAYYKYHNFQDIKVTAPVKFDQDDVSKMSQNEQINKVVLGYLEHTLIKSNNLVIELTSFEDKQLQIVKGRNPEKSGELVLDRKAQSQYKLGDSLTFLSTNGKQDEDFKLQDYKVVGFANTTRYISKNARGVTSIGDGEVDYFGEILAEDFSRHEPNSMDIQLIDKIRQKDIYSQSYAKELAKAKDAVEVVIKEKMNIVSDELVVEIDDQRKELVDKQSEIEENKENLEKELKDVTNEKKQDIVDEKEKTLKSFSEAQSLLKEHQEQLRSLKDRMLISEFAITESSRLSESLGKQLQEQQLTLNQLAGEDAEGNSSSIDALKKNYQRLLATFETNQGSLQVEVGQLEALKAQFFNLEQLVQLETLNLPSRESIEEKFADLEKERADAQQNLAESLDKLKDSQIELADTKSDLNREEEKVEKLPYTIQGIDETVTFQAFRDNIERLDVISKIIPFVFFFVAFIITTTLILRMIDQSREQIGTMLALGVNRQEIIKKYTFYSFSSSTIGLLIGIFAGIFGFSQIIISLYSPMYIFSNYDSQIYPLYIGISVAASVISVVIIPYFVYHKLFKLPALQLIRPKQASGGKTLLIERKPALWRLIPFGLQRTIRNIMSYKLRMGILLIGFIGCMSLLFIGYGARNSVDQLQKKQFYDVFKYDISIGLAEFASKEEKETYVDYVENTKKAKRLPVLHEKWESLALKNDRIDTYIISPSQPEQLNKFIELTDAETDKVVVLGPSDVFVTEKLAKIFDLKIGDSWEIINPEGLIISPKVTKIVKNYYLHYVYLGDDAYRQIFNAPAVYGRDFLLTKKWNNKDSEKALKLEAVSNIHTRNQDIIRMEEMTAQLNSLIVIVIIAASLLGAVVLYNLAYITILERKQELAVIKVMGYREKQASIYVFREIFLLGFFGIILGTFLGKFLHSVVMDQVELEFLYFPKIDAIKVFSESSSTLLIISGLLLVIMHRSIKKINTVEALKVND